MLEITNSPKKIQRGDSINYLVYNHRKYKSGDINYESLNDFQNFLGDINWWRQTSRLPTPVGSNPFQTLQGN